MITRALQSFLRKGLQTLAVHSLGDYTLSERIYPSIPASLYRFQSRSRSNLLDRLKLNEEDDNPWDGIGVSEQGLVGPGVLKDSKLRPGAMLMPNTNLFQEIARMQMGDYYDDEEAGKPVEIPFIYSFRKGTPIPSKLLLRREAREAISDMFYLQPSQPMSLKDLNMVLDEFYDQYAEKKTADEWFDEYSWGSGSLLAASSVLICLSP